MKHFRMMADLSTDFIGMTDKDGRAQYVNPAGRALCQIPLDEDIRTLTISDFHPLIEGERVREEGLPTALLHGTWKGETVLRARDGSEVPGHQILICHRNAAGGVERFSTVIRDLRPIKQLEKQLASAQRLESIGRLAGGVAHDFNNLLTVIDNCVAMVRDALPPGDARQRDLTMALTASERAAALCRQLLSFASRQIIRPHPTNLGRVIRDFSALLVRIIGEDIQLDMDVHPDTGSVMVDPSQLEQVLANLVVNARNAMPDGGLLVIGTRNVSFEHSVDSEDGFVGAGDFVELLVGDTGVGMSPEVRSRIFEPFFSQSVARGTGLGLSTVYGAVNQNGGYITVQSSPGRGSQFRIFLPRIVEEEQLQLPAEEPKTRSGTETILLVEDEDLVRSVTVRILRAAGYAVTDVGSPTIALELAKQQNQRFDLVVADVVMPDMNGMVLAEHLRRLWGGVPVLFASGYTENTIDEGGVLKGDVAFLAKPFSAAQLLDAVRRAIDRAPR